jgi:hypothetical protein
MGSKTRLLPVLFLLPALWLSAQENYRSPEAFVQRISWYADENAIRYEVVVELRENASSNYREVLRRTTEEDHLEFSLPAGTYQYRIRAWDIFEKPTAYSPWSPLEIRPALQPELFEVRTEGRDTLFLTGKNLSAETIVELRNNRGRVLNTGELLPQQAEGLNSEAILHSTTPLTPGNYEVSLQNPGGLSVVFKFTVPREPKPPRQPGPGFQVSVAYSPLVSLYGEFNELLDTPFYPAGALLRLEFLPLRFGTESSGFSLGLGISPAWHLLSTRYQMNSKEYELSGNFLGAQGFILGQIRLSKSTAINLRAGGGVFLLQNLNKHYSNESYEKINVLLPAGSGELSFLWAFRDPFFAEAGLGFTHLFSVDDPSPGYLRPSLGLGLRF